MNKLYCGFTVKVEFGQFPREKLLTLQYRQFVRGQFLLNGEAAPHKLTKNSMLSKDEFHLDGPKGGEPYGLRSTTNKELQRASTYTHSFSERQRYAEDGPLLIVFDDPGILGSQATRLRWSWSLWGTLWHLAIQRLSLLEENGPLRGHLKCPTTNRCSRPPFAPNLRRNRYCLRASTAYATAGGSERGCNLCRPPRLGVAHGSAAGQATTNVTEGI